jgi:DNA-binding XRE family transcriptional regulator
VRREVSLDGGSPPLWSEENQLRKLGGIQPRETAAIVSPPEGQAAVAIKTVPAQVGDLEKLAAHGLHRVPRRRLESAGWKVGRAKEFLGLTDEEAAMIELKLQLARALRARRVRQNLTQQQLSRKLGSSQSRVAKMEAGDPSVSLDLLMRSLLRLGATRRDLARHLGTSTGSRAA